MNEPASICMLRLSALGDVCNAVATARALRRRYPDSRLTWIIGKPAARLAAALPGIEFVVFDKRRGPGELVRLRRALRGSRFDVLLHMQVSARANLVAATVRADRRIGFDRQRAREGHGLVVDERIPAVPFQHQAEALWAFAGALGAEVQAGDRPPPIRDADRAFAREYQPEAGRAVLISPCSSHPKRNWRPERYAEVADRVLETMGRPVILVGGPSPVERATGDAIVAAMRGTPVDLIGKDTLGQSLAMLERAACLVAPDSGPVHFAAALGTPVVGLYAATWARRSGPLGSIEHCVDRFPDAARRFLGRDPEHVTWGKRIEVDGVMDLVAVDDVIERLEEALASPHAAGR
jgi:heptosyltransferase I